MKNKFNRLILRPLNRVKIMAFPKFKLGVVDVLVGGSWIIISFIAAFLLFEKIILRVVIGVGVGFGGGGIMLIGTPNKRTYNYIIHFFEYLVARKKYKEDDLQRLNSYLKIKQKEGINKDGKSIYVYKIHGNNVSYNLDNIIERKFRSLEEMFQTQGITYQIVKQERKWDDKKQLNSLKNIPQNNPKRTRIVNENIKILKSFNQEESFYSYYFIEFSSVNQKKLNIEANSIETSLSHAGLKFSQLEGQSLAKYFLKKTLPLEISKDLIFPENNGVIDMLKSFDSVLKNEKIIFKPKQIQVGNNFSKIIAIDQFSLNSGFCFLENIFDIEGTQVNMEIRNVSSDESIKMVNKAYREIVSRSGTSNNKLSDSKQQDAYLSSMEELMANITSHGEELKAVTIWITIYGKTEKELLKNERATIKAIKRSRMKYDKLFLKQLDGWLLQNIGSDNKIKERNQIEIGSEALSHSWPFTSESFTDIAGDYIGESIGGKPCFLDWKKRDEKENRHQSNSIILGSTGGGKSTFTKKIAKDEWSRGVTCYMLDPENEYEELAKSLGGITIDLSGKANNSKIVQRLNPLQVFVGDSDIVVSEKNEIFSAHFKFISDFFSQLLYPNWPDTVKEMSYLKRTIQELYKNNKIYEYKDITKIANEKWPIITDLYNQLLKWTKKTPKDFTRKEVFQDLAERLYDVTSKGTDGMLWDGYTTLDLEKETFVVFTSKTYTTREISV